MTLRNLMPEPELHATKITKSVPACETGRHIAHPGDTCEETDELQAVVRAYFEACMAEAYAHATRVLVHGEETGGPYGFLSAERIRVPYPISDAEMADHGFVAAPDPDLGERAFAVLEPHLHDVPLYRPRFTFGGVLPRDVGASADVPHCHPGCRWPVVG